MKIKAEMSENSKAADINLNPIFNSFIEMQLMGPGPWLPAQTHTASHGAGGLPAQRLAPRVVVDGVPEALRDCRDPPPGLESEGHCPGC